MVCFGSVFLLAMLEGESDNIPTRSGDPEPRKHLFVSQIFNFSWEMNF